MAVTHIALIRGINVGKAKRIAMSDLKKLVEKLGYGDVKTLLNSGNVVFSAPKVSSKTAAEGIEQGLEKATGVSARVLVITAKELATIVEENPLLKEADNDSRLMVSVLWNPADLKKLKPLAEKDWGKERLGLGTRTAFMWCPDGSIDSPLAIAVGKVLKDDVTTRNWATIQKLQALANP